MQDAETQEIIYVDTTSEKVRTIFAKERDKNTMHLKTILAVSGVDLIDIKTGVDYVRPLINFFKNRGNRR